MNYKELLDKLAELEARIEMLEQGQRKRQEFTPAPTQPNWVEHTAWPKNLDITCKGIVQ